MAPVTPEIRQAVQDAARALESQGFNVQPFRPQALEEARQLWWKFFVRGGAMLLEPLVQRRQSELSPTFLDFLSIAHREPPFSAQELLSAWMDFDHVRRKLLAEMERFPILLCPVCAIPAFRPGERAWEVEGRQVEVPGCDALHAVVQFTGCPRRGCAGSLVARRFADWGADCRAPF